jgi:outer membrane protein TolC
MNRLRAHVLTWTAVFGWASQPAAQDSPPATTPAGPPADTPAPAPPGGTGSAAAAQAPAPPGGTGSAGGATGTPLTLSRALVMATAHSRELGSARAAVRGARHRLTASHRLRWPTLRVESNLLVWNEQIEFDLAGGGTAAPAGETPPPLVVRDRITSTTSISLVEPLSAQIVIGKLVAADRLGLEASLLDQRSAQLDLATRVCRAYFALLLAGSAAEIARVSLGQIDSQLERARVLAGGGLLQRVDLMRLEAARAEAARQRIAADNERASAADQLALAVGLPLDRPVTAVDQLPPEPARPPLDERRAIELALAGRSDLRAVQTRGQQASRSAEVARAEMYPNLVGVATFQHSEGSGTFAAENAGFVGLNLQWDAWDWGHDWHAYKEARARAEQASIGAEQLRDQVVVEARSQLRTAQAAHQALGVARVGLAAAEEAFRIADVRFREGALTTTDLLAAQTDVARARLGHATARYTYFLALTALARATGQAPDQLLPRTP